METMSRNVFPADNTYRVLIDLFIFRTAPPLSKYKVNDKTVKILFSVRSTQEAKSTMTFRIMWTEFLAFSPLGEKTTIILIHSGLPLPGWAEIRQWAYNTQRPLYKDGDTCPSLVLTGILDRGTSRRSNFGSSVGLNPNAPAWTPGLCSSGERSGDSPDRNGRAAHCVGMHHKREVGVESDGVGWLNLPVNQDKHQADKFSQRVRAAIKEKQKKGAGRRGGGAGLSVGVLGKQHMWPGRGRRVYLLG